jgi:hypothetical protein
MTRTQQTMPTIARWSSGSYYKRSSCPSGYSSGMMDIDVLMGVNVTQTIMFQICHPSDDNSLALGLGLGLGLGIPALLLFACCLYCYCPKICGKCRRRENNVQLVPHEITPSVILFEYFGQNLHRQFNTGILTDELRAHILVAPQHIRNHMVTVAMQNNRMQIIEYLNGLGLNSLP